MLNTKFATKNDLLQTVKQQKINPTKTILLDMRQKILNQVFAIILVHFI